MVTSNFILIGANSELASEFAKELKSKKQHIYGVSRKNIPYLLDDNQIQLTNYTEDKESLIKFIKNIDNPYIIFFNGFLAENRPIYYPNFKEISETINANYLVPIELTNQINEHLDIKKFIYISSIAAIKPRNKNYIYGLSKKNLEEYIMRFENLNFLILRFGQIRTRMSSNHKTPPFTMSKKEASKRLYKKLDKNGVIYPTVSLYLISLVIKLLPTKFIDFLEK